MAKPRELRQRRGWAFAFAVMIVKPLLLLFTKRRWVDGHKLPAEGGCVVVGNHISHIDPLTFAHLVYDHGRLPRYLAKAAVFDVPFVGMIVRKRRPDPGLPVDRRRLAGVPGSGGGGAERASASWSTPRARSAGTRTCGR